MATNTTTAWNFNRYNYANNNPYRFTDPDGRNAAVLPGLFVGGAILCSRSTACKTAVLRGVAAAAAAFAGGKLLTEKQAPPTDGEPSAADKWTGTNPREREGRVNTDGTTDPVADWERITGGESTTDADGTKIGPKGERYRETDEGPRIDLPAESTGNRKHETIHYPPPPPPPPEPEPEPESLIK